jgi:hypothetical protein
VIGKFLIALTLLGFQAASLPNLTTEQSQYEFSSTKEKVNSEVDASSARTIETFYRGKERIAVSAQQWNDKGDVLEVMTFSLYHNDTCIYKEIRAFGKSKLLERCFKVNGVANVLIMDEDRAVITMDKDGVVLSVFQRNLNGLIRMATPEEVASVREAAPGLVRFFSDTP